MPPQPFDAIIIGAGQAGPSLAARLTAAGQRIAFVERHLFGGTCVNSGCTPTKAMVASAYAAHTARRAAEYGVSIDTDIEVDLHAVQARRDAIVEKSRTGVEKSLRDNTNITVFTGTASLTSPTTVRVGDTELSAPQIFLNVGCRATIPDLPGIHETPYLDSTSLLALPTLPAHLIIIGGSYIGIEFAQMYRRFGSQVTIVERSPRLASREDEDVSACIRSILEAEGIAVRTSAECISLSKNGLAPREDGVSVGTNCTADSRPILGSHVLLAVGRTPNTQDLGLAAAGVAADKHGYITVDDHCRTSVPGIFALGDCNGRGAFTHTAYNDFEIVAANILDHDDRKISDRIPCYAMYCDPPLARIGLTEAEVRATGRPAFIATRPMSRVNRALEKGESLGFMKVLVDAESHLILGASLLGVGGDEAIHALLTAMYARTPYTTLQRAVFIHPTVSELLPTLLAALKPLH
jgi:pyruvate/2-oxoglutarate dehydrogenase complex dihydrolipoamide dehydrogenase (E3) component